MQALILCGGKGLRIRGNFGSTPKPLISIRGKPLLAYIVEHYKSYGVTDFFLLVGDGESAFQAFSGMYSDEERHIRVLQTGNNTLTGGRLSCALPFLAGEGPVLVTYGDGIADVDIDALVACHGASGKAVTLTVVNPRLPFGLVEFDAAGTVTSFIEKPRMTQYASAGFFVVERDVLDVLELDADFEGFTLPLLAEEGRLGAYVHQGFWKSIDTYKDYVEINDAAMQLPV